ncbi:hypothetical protein WA026_017624 [Henosepilachna vigintioctopunctata]|uniref:Uncharacterized protein n=1 Tax=Henosepilachna vigintioctopunctata TaxID=420089 RepID=A0AAW1UW44_9CUCU
MMACLIRIMLRICWRHKKGKEKALQKSSRKQEYSRVVEEKHPGSRMGSLFRSDVSKGQINRRIADLRNKIA